MTTILKKASISDKDLISDFSLRLNKKEHIDLKRDEKITKAIMNQECFLILTDNLGVGFAIFDYSFFDLGWIELLIIDERYRGKGIGTQVIKLLCVQSKTSKVFTSTNKSNQAMQAVLKKCNFNFAGEIIGLDDGDPELFYYKEKP